MEGKTMWLGILVVLGMIALGGMGSAQLTVNATDTASVTVTLAMKTMIDITPSDLYWTVDPGEVCGRDISHSLCNETGDNFRAVQIENIGSRNITAIWFNATYPTQSPFATGSTGNTDSGNYVMLTHNISSGPFYFVNRVEYNTSAELWYVTDPSGNMPPDNSQYTYGRFHNNSKEYFWFINAVYDGDGNCNDSTYIRIGKLAHTKTQTGSVDFSNPANYDEITLTPGSTYATGDINVGPLRGYSVAVSNSPAGCRVMFSHWNKDTPFDTLSQVEYTFYSTSNPLVPGDSFARLIGVSVPYGIHEGASNSGTLTVVVTAA